MENGAGTVDETHMAALKTVEDGFSVSKVEETAVSAFHGLTNCEGDEVFEEATDGNLDVDDAYVMKVDADDVDVSTTADVVTVKDSGLPELDGNSIVGQEGEVAEDAAQISVWHESNELESVEKGEDSLGGDSIDEISMANAKDKGGTIHGAVPVNIERVFDDDLLLACANSKGAIEDSLAQELTEEGKNEFMTYAKDRRMGKLELLVAGDREGSKVVEKKLMDNDQDSNEMVVNDVDPMNEERIINDDYWLVCGDRKGAIEEAVSEKLKGAGSSESMAYEEDKRKEGELGLLKVGEGEVSMGVEEKSVQMSVDKEKSENGDPDEMQRNGEGVSLTMKSDGHRLHQYENFLALNDESSVSDDNCVDKLSTNLGDASYGFSSEDQHSNVVTSDEKHDGSAKLKGAPVSFSPENQDTIGVTSHDSSGSNTAEPQDGENGKSGDNVASLHPGKHEGGSKLEDSASSTSVESGLALECQTLLPDSSIKKNDKCQIATFDLGRGGNSTYKPQPANDCAVGIRDYQVVEEPVTKREQNGQVSTEMEIKPAAAPNSSSGRSANPTLPAARPAGLGRAAPLLEPAPRALQHPRPNGSVSQVQGQLAKETANGEAEEGDEAREKLQMIRVKFLRLAHRLGQTPHNVVVAQVLYRLGLAEQLRGRNGGRVGTITFDRASAMAEQLEATGQESLDFSCTIVVLGKTGVGKSATINSIFDEVKFSTDAFQLGTKKVQDVIGTVQGIKVRVIDTPGLLPSLSDQHQNEKILHSVKRFIKKTPPDIVLYLDRLDMQSRDFGDLPLLRTITEIFGPSIWFNAIVVLTHAASAPPEGPNGTASTYDMFVTQRSHAVQQAIRQAAGDMRLMNPVSLVENHSACRTNRAGQRVLPNGQVWKPHLLLLSFASKILAEANTLLKLQDTPHGRLFATRPRTLSLPVLLSSLLQPKPQFKLLEEQFGDDDALDDSDEPSDSDDEMYDKLPPFKPLTKAQLAKLSKDQKRAYYEELEYREKLFMKKQLKEQKERQKMKKMAHEAKELPGDYDENVDDASGAVPMPDFALPASFDSDYPTHRYRSLDNSNQWLVRPVLDPQGWDHDVGYEGINVERLFVIKEMIPLSFSGQVSKDKKEVNLQMEMGSFIKHGEGKATALCFDMQSVGKDMMYTLRSETRLHNNRHNKANAGLSFTRLGDALTAGMKVEDELVVNKRFRMVISGGAMSGRGDVAYGGSLEATLRDREPLGRQLSSLGLSVMDWHGDLALGCNVQSQIPIGQYTNVVARASLNNKGAGQFAIRMNSSEQLQLALVGLIPLIRKLMGQPQQPPFGY